jgi:hypothetical protein
MARQHGDTPTTTAPGHGASRQRGTHDGLAARNPEPFNLPWLQSVRKLSSSLGLVQFQKRSKMRDQFVQLIIEP